MPFEGIENALRFIGERVFLIARKIPALVMLEAEIVDHGCEEKNQRDLDDHVQSDLNAMDLLRFRLGNCFVSHRLQSPLAGLKSLIGESQHHDGHAEVKDDRARIELAARKRSHLLNRGKITEQLPRRRADIEHDELH